MPKRYLVVRVQSDQAFTAIRKLLHDFSRETDEELADVGTNMMGAGNKARVEYAFEETLAAAKSFKERNGK